MGTVADAGTEEDAKAGEDVNVLAEAREEEPGTERIAAESREPEDVPGERSPGAEGCVLFPAVTVSF